MFYASVCHQANTHWRRALGGLTAILYVLSTVLPASAAALPAPGELVRPTDMYQATHLRGIRIYHDHPLKFDFIIRDADQPLAGDAYGKEAEKLIKYFLASLTIPEDQMWVNLSPYEEGRIISPGLGATEMGRDLLAQDYLLKQLSASLMYPEEDLGREFWARIHRRVYREFGTTALPVNTFNKVWIVPDRAVVYEQDGAAYVVDRHLKVMLEADYAASDYVRSRGVIDSSTAPSSPTDGITAQIVREVIIPEIEKEVNQGRTFANLRQIYNAMILATWYKRKLKDGLLSRVYVDHQKTRGIDLEQPRAVAERIYRRYLEAFRKGVYDLIREDHDPGSREVIPRRYFSGGLVYRGAVVQTKTDAAMLSSAERAALRAQSARDRMVTAMLYEVTGPRADQAMEAEETDEERAWRWAQVKEDLYPDGEMKPVKIASRHDGVQNLVVLDAPGKNFAHASAWKINGHEPTVGHSFDLTTPTGNRKVTFDVIAPEGLSEDGFPFKIVLQDVKATPSVDGRKTFQRPELLTSEDGHVNGSEFVIRLDNLEGLESLVISSLRFGSAKSIKDEKRSGPSDPTAALYTRQFADEGRDIKVDNWTKRGEPRFRATTQPRTPDGLHDSHNYLVEMDFHQEGFRPGSVTVALTEDNDIIVNKDSDVKYVILRVRLYSDHEYLEHMSLDELYDLPVLEYYATQRIRDREWFGDRASPEQIDRYKRLVRQLRRHILDRGEEQRQLRAQELLRTRIQKMAADIGQPTEFTEAALDPVNRYDEIPFFEVERLETLLYTGQFLITRSAAILAGSPYYLTPFGGDVIIILRELLEYLRPEVVREQFYHLLKLVRNGQLAHEVDIRFRSDDERHMDLRLESPRLDTELLLLMFASSMLDHPQYGIDWQRPLTKDKTAAQLVEEVARYVLARADSLNSSDDYRQLYGPADGSRDPRLDWEDATSSKAYGKYSHLIQYLVPFALKAVNKLSEKEIMSEDTAVDPALIDNWVKTREQFRTTVSREYRIDALMQWYAWRLDRTDNGRRFVLALLADAKEYYGIEYEFNSESDEQLLRSIRRFLESYVPQGDFTYQAKVLDAGGNPVRVADTNPLIFATSTADGVRIEEIKHGLELVFTHVAFGGVALVEGAVQTGIPTVKDGDREVRQPLNIDGPIPSTDLYEIYHKNYHGMIVWLSMNYKRLNGLIRQINHRLSNEEGWSTDAQMMYAAVEVLNHEMSQLAEMITEETLEPYVNGHQRFRWRPYGSETSAGESDGIQSGAMQGFNMMALPALGNLRKLRTRIASLPPQDRGPSFVPPAEDLRNMVRDDPEAVRRFIRRWAQVAPETLGKSVPTDNGGDNAVFGKADSQVDAADNVGGIDLSGRWLDLQIRRDQQGVPLPLSDQPVADIESNIQGFYPVIINVVPIRIPLLIGWEGETEGTADGDALQKDPGDFRRQARL